MSVTTDQTAAEGAMTVHTADTPVTDTLPPLGDHQYASHPSPTSMALGMFVVLLSVTTATAMALILIGAR